MLVKVYVNLVDYSSRPEDANFHLNECLKIKGYSDYLVDIDGTDFMVVADDNLGARYNDEDPEEWNRIVEEYQEKVTEAAKDLSAGSSSYLYLPSAETLFKDNSTSYEDLKLSIYYYRTSQESSTNLDTNNLSISIPTICCISKTAKSRRLPQAKYGLCSTTTVPTGSTINCPGSTST